MHALREVQADALAKNGDGVVSAERLHVPGLLPGETAQVRLVHRGRQRAHAELVALRQAHPGRQSPPCPHQGRCSGCPLMIASAPLQAELKRALLAELGIDVEAVWQGEPFGYRWSAKRVVGGRAGALRLGSWQRGSHRLADMDGCRVDHPDIAAVAGALCAVASELGIVPYDEATRRGDLRYVWLKTDGAGRVLVTLVTARRETRAPAIADALPSAAGVAWCVQPSEGNALRGDDLTLLRGDDHLALVLCGEVVRVGPLGFLQPNPRVIAHAYPRLVASDDTGLALDLYAGAGITTALLRRRFRQVRACEAYPESAAALGIAPQTAEAFLAEVRAGGARPDLVVANPPRAGLGEAVCDALLALAPPRLHLMSCDPWALSRDLARLRPHYDTVDAMAYDALPHTAHVEVVVRLQKKSASPSSLNDGRR